MAEIIGPQTADVCRTQLIAKLQVGLPTLTPLGDASFAAFTAKRLRNPILVWINDRWLLKRGIDITASDVRAEIETWMLASFAFSIPLARDPEEAFVSEWQTFHADRYGGGNGHVRHGGSGRVGTLGAFQVKGIGATPLVGDIDNWSYSHGCLWLEEAIREAICGEIADQEFPHAAVPVIAIIDTGLAYPFDDERIGERRALLVRPLAFRPAHLERAALFSAGDDTRLAQILDVKRVKDAVRIFTSADQAGNELGIAVKDAKELVENIARQIAFGQVHRLFHGGYYSSNLGINGELLDFGSFRSLPDWEKSLAMDHAPPFGEEIRLLTQIIESLVFHLNKYRVDPGFHLDKVGLIELANATIESEFTSDVLSLWGLNWKDANKWKHLANYTTSYYKRQQERLRSYASRVEQRGEWIYDSLVCVSTDEVALNEQSWIDEVDDLLRVGYGSGERANRGRILSWLTASRLLEPRIYLFREVLQNCIYGVIGGDATISPKPTVVRALIDRIVSESRRHWPLLPLGFQVRSQVCSAGSSALICARAVDDAVFVWLEGAVIDNCWVAFNAYVPLAALASHVTASEGGRMGILVSLPAMESVNSSFRIVIDGIGIEVPAPVHLYSSALNLHIVEMR